MPGVVRRNRSFGSQSALKGFTGRKQIGSAVLLAASVQPAGVDEVQVATIGGGPTGGTFTLSFGGQTTANIAYNAAASAVEDALEALSSIGAGNVRVTGSAGGPYTVTFLGDLGQQNVAQMTAAHALTGGTSPSVAVATSIPGDATDAGRLLFRRNTILTEVPGNTSKVRRYTAQSGEAIIGICGRDVELFDNSSASDVDLPVWKFGAVFDKTLIHDYATYQSQLATWAAANGCVFE